MKILNDCMRYIRWRNATDAHPDILVSNDIDTVIGSGQFFARKFDINVDGNVLDMIDVHIDRLKE
jgi:hypothetical protein